MTRSAARAGRGDGDHGDALNGKAAFRRLWTARGVSTLGDSAGLVALLLFVAGTRGQGFAVAALLLVGDFAPALLGPLSGGVSDRFDRRRVLIGCELAQAATVVIIALTLPSLPLLLALVGLRAVAGQVFQPAVRGAVPALVPDSGLAAANAALGFVSNGMEAAGPMVAAGLLPLVGIRGVLWMDAGTFLVSAAILSRLPALPAAAEPGPRPSWLAHAGAGLRYLATVPQVRTLSLGFIAVVAFTGVDDVALVFLSRDTLHAGDSAVVLLYSAVGIGLLLGYLVLGRRVGRSPLVPLFLIGCAVSSLGNLLTGLAWALAVAFAVQFVRGVGVSAIDVSVNTLLQRQVAPEMIGRVFGTLYGAIGIAAGTSYLLGALLLELTNPRVTFIVAGCGGLVATLITAAVLGIRRPDRDQQRPDLPDVN